MEGEEPLMKQERYSKHGKDASLDAISILPPQCLAQNRLILRILQKCLMTLKLSMVLPKVFENPITVYLVLKGTEYEHCSTILLEYLKERDKNVELVAGGQHCYDEKLITLINTFHDNHLVLDLLPNWFNTTTMSDHFIVEAFDLLTHIVDQRMHRSAHIELEKEKQMHKFFRENMALRKEIDYLRRKLRMQKQHQRWKRALRSSDTFRLQDELVTKKWQHVSTINNVISENAQHVKQLNFGHANKINVLEEEAIQLQTELMKVKAANAKQLKSVREEKNKLLIQLQTTIEKHDRLLGEKIKENVYLQDEYEKQREEMEIFMVGYTALEKEYHESILYELAEAERKWQIKANLFFQTRAARIIQRYFRKYLAQRKSQHSGGKGKKAKAQTGVEKKGKDKKAK